MQIKRTEGKAALAQCQLDKQTLQFTATRFVRENPWTTLGISACAVLAVSRVKGLSGMMSSISSISVLFGGTMDLSRQFAEQFVAGQAAPEQSISESSVSEQ
ncbi:hypothetical protein BSQ33_03155 [Vibrio gazogenes]|uniref:Uncharacterized protein n=2 Tax=Vibrio gazogenes TaxID=687 RepID=A0A1Z2SCG7_VIBGA|nr:hypothetical protein BSQ33_03155 [Vibrio gazogenes]